MTQIPLLFLGMGHWEKLWEKDRSNFSPFQEFTFSVDGIQLMAKSIRRRRIKPWMRYSEKLHLY